MIQDARYIGCYAGRGKQSDGAFNDYAMPDWPYNGHSGLSIDICIRDCTNYRYGFKYVGVVCLTLYQITCVQICYLFL